MSRAELEEVDGLHERASDAPGGATFWIGAAIGLSVMGFGLRGLLTNAGATRPMEFAKWFIGADLVHDLVVAPVVVLVGFVVARTVARRWRRPVAMGLAASAIVLAVGWAPLRGYGRANAPGNVTVQPLDYATAVPTVLAVVWLLVAGWLLIIAANRRWRSRA